jgi:hypothetical protein
MLNGGTVAARSLCLEAIRDRQTDGDLKRAEKILSQIVSRGVAGLAGHTLDPVDDTNAPQTAPQPAPLTPKAHEKTLTGDEVEEEWDSPSECPSSIAMKAAEDLTRSTDDLQPATSVDDLPGNQPNTARLLLSGAGDAPIKRTVVSLPGRASSLTDMRISIVGMYTPAPSESH